MKNIGGEGSFSKRLLNVQTFDTGRERERERERERDTIGLDAQRRKCNFVISTHKYT